MALPDREANWAYALDRRPKLAAAARAARRVRLLGRTRRAVRPAKEDAIPSPGAGQA
jgi:hypothetical protein